MRVDVFGKDGCAMCESTKRKLDHYIRKWGIADRIRLNFHNMNTAEGLAEGAFVDVLKVPTTIISNSDGIADVEPLGRWEGVIPSQDDIKICLAGPLNS